MSAAGRAASGATFLGYRRPDGRAGTRNHVAVVAVMDNVNPVVRRICASVRGTVAVCPSHGRGEVGADLEQHLRTLAGLASNPNVYGIVIVGLEPVMPRQVAERLDAAGRPVATISIDECGSSLATLMAGIRLAQRMVIDASILRREPVPLSELIVGVECGGSDTTSGVVGNPALGLVSDRLVAGGGTVVMSETVEWMGAEHILARRAATPELGEQIVAAVRWYEDYARSIGISISDTNPSPDNKRGGLTTIEEKSIGAIKKGGSTPVRALIRYAERVPCPGLVLMDAPPPGTENVTGLAACGAQAIVFVTGKGNPIATPIAPTIKVTGNPRTIEVAPENVDVDLTGVVTRGLTLGDAADTLYARLIDHANGKLTSAEVLGDEETAISRIGQSV